MYGLDICRQQWQTAVMYLALLAAVETRRNCFVNTTLGPVEGSTERSRHGKYFCSFRGIPYAAPPIGELRFKVTNSPVASGEFVNTIESVVIRMVV
jgi:hypothetical protein